MSLIFPFQVALTVSEQLPQQSTCSACFKTSLHAGCLLQPSSRSTEQLVAWFGNIKHRLLLSLRVKALHEKPSFLAGFFGESDIISQLLQKLTTTQGHTVAVN